MAYDTHWQRRERWKVTGVTGMGSTMDTGDFLRFEGDAGGGTGKLIRKDKTTGVETEWGKNCRHIPGSVEIMTVENLALGNFTITHTRGSHQRPPGPDTPATLKCVQDGGPTGAEWTAVEQLPTLP